MAVAHVKPLNLKRQRTVTASRRTTDIEPGDLQAEVVLDLGIFHFEQSFTYAVPDQFTELLSVGSIVQVQFKNTKHNGLVVAIEPRSKRNLLSIEGLRATNVFSSKQMAFFEKVAERYLANFGQLILKSLPQLNKSTQLQGRSFSEIPGNSMTGRRSFVPVSLDNSNFQVMSKYLNSAHNEPGSTLLIFPTLKALEEFRDAWLKGQGINHIEVGAHLSPTQRRLVFEKLLTLENLVILGLRSGIFIPARDLARIYILDESSPQYTEQRSPYWNLRDVSLLRSEAEGCEVVFFGHGCSAELQRLMDLNWVKPTRTNSSLILTKRIQSSPSSYFEIIRNGLKQGPVLVCLATKDYAPGFVCRNCRNRARCKCGGLLSLKDKGSAACSICDAVLNDWRCVECQSMQYLVYRSGAKKVVEEIGKAFPGRRVVLSSTDSVADTEIDEKCIVISTYSTLVQAKNGYTGMVLLEGEEMLARQFIRAEEELFNLWLNILSLARPGAEIFLSLPSSNPVSQAIIAGKPIKFMQYLNKDRLETNLPPYVRIIQIEGEIRALSGLRIRLENEFGNLLNTLISNSGTRLTLKAKHEGAAELLKSLKALQKMRSSSGKELFAIKVDPYYL
jgi:primosomal protein N' (replication factor Y)